jgi:hypothetical protein
VTIGDAFTPVIYQVRLGLAVSQAAKPLSP